MCREPAVATANKASTTISEVVSESENFVYNIVVVDDSCPEGTAEVQSSNKSKKLTIFKREENGEVGLATKDAIRIRLDNDADIGVKVNAYLPMPPEKLPELIQPLIDG